MGVNMISNSDMIKATSIYHHVCYQSLSSNVLRNGYFNERIPLACLFKWNYEFGFTADMPFRANLDNGANKSFIDNFLWSRYD